MTDLIDEVLDKCRAADTNSEDLAVVDDTVFNLELDHQISLYLSIESHLQLELL